MKYKVFACFYENKHLRILKLVPKGASESEFLSDYLSLSLVGFFQWLPLSGRRKNIKKNHKRTGTGLSLYLGL